MACKMNVQFLVLLVLAAVAQEQLAAASKFAYTKPLYGKSNFVKEKRFKLRATSTTPAAAAVAATAPTRTTTTSTTSTTTTTTTEAAWPSSVEFIINTSPKTRTATESADASIESTSNSKGISTSSSSSSTFSPSISSFTTTPSTVQSTAAYVEFDMEPGSSSSASNTITTTVNSTTPSSLDNTLPSPPTPATTTTTTVAPTEAADNQPVPCTCGVFLSSQIRNALPEKPLIHNEMDRMYPCNAIGRKQCQTKCLEAIVQHLPNSANIVCATLGHNCHKERAYLFIKNCHNQWVNTKLQAGREYCCKEGTPYRCPLLG